VSDIFLTTKIRIPPLRSKLINRTNLIQRLNDGIVHNKRLTIVSAPAGYGKSTLLSEWASRMEIPVAWLSLENDENSPIRFWNYFVRSLGTIPHLHGVGSLESITQALGSVQPPPLERLIANLVNDLSELELSAVLVLDDLHCITDHQIHKTLIFLLDHLSLSPQRLHLVIASRMDPPWPLARWRERDELSELRPSDLRFSYEETLLLLNQVLQLGLMPPDIIALQERTEGWIAGLQLAALSMQARLQAQGTPGVSRFLESFTGSNRYILDFLLEEVINQQPKDICDFLYATSILEHMTAPLCSALLGRQDCQAILDQVEQANLFLIPLDDERQWYRYHTLFAELLRKRLKLMQPDYILQLYRSASDWYAANNFLAEAINHAMAAGDFLQVNKLVSGNVLAMVEHAELFKVLMHFEQIPVWQIVSKPWLGVAYAWTKAYVDPSAEMGRLLTQIEQGFTGQEDALEKRHLTSHLDAIRAYVAWIKGNANEALPLARSALENLPDDDWITRNHILNIEGLVLQFMGNLDGAIQSFEAAIIAGEMTGRPYETFHAYTNLAYVYIIQGRLHQAFSLCQQVLNSADQSSHVAVQLPVLAYAYATISLVQLEWNEVETAVASARKGVAMAEQWKQADTLHFALTCLSNALCAAGDLEEACAVNRRSSEFAVNVSSWFYRISACDEIRLQLMQGNVAAAAHRFAEIEPLVEDAAIKAVFLYTKASLLYAQGHYLDTILVLQEPVREYEREGLGWYLLKLLLLQALALRALGKEEALGIVEHCLTMAKPEGYVRIFVDHGAPMVELLRAALQQGIEPDYVNKLLLAFNHPEVSQTLKPSLLPKIHPTVQKTDLVEPLSERELQVLRLLDSPLTSEEISRELYVSVHTVRTHIRNIYSKMDVHRRIEAIRKAKDIGLI